MIQKLFWGQWWLTRQKLILLSIEVWDVPILLQWILCICNSLCVMLTSCGFQRLEIYWPSFWNFSGNTDERLSKWVRVEIDMVQIKWTMQGLFWQARDKWCTLILHQAPGHDHIDSKLMTCMNQSSTSTAYVYCIKPMAKIDDCH